MYENIHEPLASLAEIGRETLEKEKEKQDRSINRALFLLAVLEFSLL